MLSRNHSYIAAVRHGSSEDYSDADYIASSLPLNYNIFPIFQVIAIPINRTVSGRLFRSLVIIMELYAYHPGEDMPFPTSGPHTGQDVVRLHYLYSLETPDGLHRLSLCTTEVSDYITRQTQFLNEVEKRNFDVWGRAYRRFVPPDGTHDDFWYRFYGRFEDDRGQQRPVSDPGFSPIDLSSDSTTWEFSLPAHSTAPATTMTEGLLRAPGAALTETNAAAPLHGVAGYGHECGAAVTLLTVPTGGVMHDLYFARRVAWAHYGANDTAAYRSPLGISANTVEGLGLLCESVNLFNWIRERRMGETGVRLATLTYACRVTAFSLWARYGATLSSSAGAIAGNMDAAAAGMVVITNLYSLYRANQSRKTMAECLARLEIYYQRSSPDVLQHMAEEVTTSNMERGTYQHHAGFYALYAMVAWLARKYRRHLKGQTVSTGKNIASFGIAIGIAICVAVASIQTTGLVAAIGSALGLFYLGVTTAHAIGGNCNNAEILAAYKESVEALHTRRQIPDDEYAQEQILFALADKVHPIRHHAFGTTMGDYMRVKIASFVITTKRAATDAPDAFGPEHPQLEMLKLCADLMGAAIGYNATRHGQFTTHETLRMCILRLGANIPLRGY